MNRTDEELTVMLDVTAKEVEADGVVVLELRDPGGAELPEWAPGAHVDLALPNGITRQYSLCGDVRDRSVWRVGVLRDTGSRGGSAFVHDRLRVGDPVRVNGPRNHFAFEASPSYVFIAGGIGITPILTMIASADDAGAEWELHYGGRERGAMAFLEVLTDLHGDRVTVYPHDEVGLIDLGRILGSPRAETLVYACGPEPMLSAVEDRCGGWPSGTLHVERFTPRQTAPPILDVAFDIELSRTRTTLRVPPDKSILEVVEDAGVRVLSSCAEGTCGSCETTVLAGEVDHRDSLLTPAERAANDTIFLCVSRSAAGRLVLEL